MLSVQVFNPYGLSQWYPNCVNQYLRVSLVTLRCSASTVDVSNFDKLSCILSCLHIFLHNRIGFKFHFKSLIKISCSLNVSNYFIFLQ